MTKVYGIPLKHHTPKFSHTLRSKDEETFREIYGIYPVSEEVLNQFLKGRSGRLKAEKGFSKYDRFHTEK